MAPGNKSSMAATNIIETPQVPHSPVPDQGADALVLLSGVDHLISNDDTTCTDVASSSSICMVDALMTLTSETPKNDGKDRTSTSGVVTNSSAVPVQAITKNEALVAGGSGTGSAGNDGQGGSGSGSGKKAAVKTQCIGRWNGSTRWTTVLDQGEWRNHMEDRIMTIHNFMSMPCHQFGGCISPDCDAATSKIHYLGLFDGHGGSQVSDYCASNLHKLIEEEWTSETGVDDWVLKWHIALSRAYERADEKCKNEPLARSAGSTAVVVLVSACQIIAANCGDSRAVLVRKRETIPLTTDHKPDRIDEMQRIGKVGGCILNIRGVLRVAGILTMTRAIGDQSLKPWVSSNPEITFTTRSKEDECLIIASDGVWDVMTTDEVGTLALKLIRRKRQAALSGDGSSVSVANLILEEARSKFSTDNISVIAVDLKPLRKRRPMQP